MSTGTTTPGNFVLAFGYAALAAGNFIVNKDIPTALKDVVLAAENAGLANYLTSLGALLNGAIASVAADKVATK